MRSVNALFVVSVLLFVGGTTFVVTGAAERRRSTSAPPAAAAASVTPVASIKQIMGGIVGPGATVVYGAVATNVTAKGVENVAPKDDEAWAAVGNSAAAIVEAGNLLLMPGRAVDQGDWLAMTRAMMEAGAAALKATDAKDADGVLTAGSDLNTTCDNCHAKYQR